MFWGSLAVTAFAVATLSVALFLFVFRDKHVGIGLPSYLAHRMRSRASAIICRRRGTQDIIFCIVDHFEPIAEGSTKEQERKRIAYWLRVPCVTLRDETAGVETLELAWKKLVGTDPKTMCEAAQRPVPPEPSSEPFGNGRAAESIVAGIAKSGCGQTFLSH